MEKLTKKQIETIFTEPSSFIVTMERENSISTQIDILKRAYSRGLPVIFILFHEPHISYRKRLEDKHIPTDNIVFIDTISKFVSNTVKEQDGVEFLSSPEQLENVGTVVSMHLQNVLDQKALILIDSLQALNAYNDFEDIKKFIHDIKERAMTADQTMVAFNDISEIEDLLNQSDLYSGSEFEYMGERVRETKVIRDKNDRKAVLLPHAIDDELGWDTDSRLSWYIEGNTLHIEEE